VSVRSVTVRSVSVRSVTYEVCRYEVWRTKCVGTKCDVRSVTVRSVTYEVWRYEVCRYEVWRPSLSNFLIFLSPRPFRPRYSTQIRQPLLFLQSEWPNCTGRAVAPAVNRRCVTADGLVRSITSPYGIYGGKSVIVTGFFFRSTSVFLSRYHSTDALYSYFILLPPTLYILNLTIYGAFK
jgi:hypothetical protein